MLINSFKPVFQNRPNLRVANLSFGANSKPQTPAVKFDNIMNELYQFTYIKGKYSEYPTVVPSKSKTFCEMKNDLINLIEEQSKKSCIDFAKEIDKDVIVIRNLDKKHTLGQRFNSTMNELYDFAFIKGKHSQNGLHIRKSQTFLGIKNTLVELIAEQGNKPCADFAKEINK